jgi:lysyl-tRNA synthetase class 2
MSVRTPLPHGRRYRDVPFFMSLAAVAAAVIGLLSAARPSWHGPLSFAQNVVDPAAQSLARGSTVAVSIGLLFVARGLARRRRRAWQLAVALMFFSVLLHVIKDADRPESLVSLVALVALLIWRREFYAVSDPVGHWVALRAGALALAGLYFYGLAAVYFDELRHHAPVSFAHALHEVTWGVVGLDLTLRPTTFQHRLTLSLVSAAVVLFVVVVWLAIRPPRSGANQSARDRADARRLVERFGDDSLAYFALRRDKSYFFNEPRTAFLAYRAVGGVALVSGDPVGHPDDRPALLESFVEHCRHASWRIAVIGVAESCVPLWAAVGLRALNVGDEAVVHPERFTLEGRVMRKVRQSVTRLERAGFAVHFRQARDCGPAEWMAINTVSEIWREGQPERGFSMALDDMQAGEHGDAWFVLGYDGEDKLAGFLHFVPVPVRDGLSLSAMRRLHDTPNGFVEYLLSQTFLWGKQRGLGPVSLNFAAFGGLLRAAKEPQRPSQLVARYAVAQADRFFQVQSLLDFNRKFLPEWHPRFLAVEALSDVPQAGLVVLSLERLVGLPGPLRRLWLRLRALREREGAAG